MHEETFMIGHRLRELRTARGLSLRELATQVEVSPGLLSQIENGVTDPSLTTLRKLAAVFDATVADLFTAVGSGAVHVSRPGHRALLSASDGHFTYARLTPGRGDLEVLHGELAAGRSSSAEPWAHPSTECAVVLAGTLTAEVAGERHRLTTGMSISFDSRLPHRYLNEDDVRAEYVVSVTPPNP
jgi:transcriptional regulator with XRE-family HTH domain